MRSKAKVLKEIFERLYSAFGPQHWWPGDTPFEVAVGAILTQNTNWGNVERAIGNMKEAKALSARRIHEMSRTGLAELIRPAGYFNVKSVRLKEFVDFLMQGYGGSIKRMGKEDTSRLRGKLLGVRGIGPETADSILLYALLKPVFVVDAYTKRVLSRHGLMDHEEPYDRFQELFHDSFDHAGLVDSGQVPFFNEYHALLVMAGKTFCRPRAPLCGECPLGDINILKTDVRGV